MPLAEAGAHDAASDAPAFCDLNLITHVDSGDLDYYVSSCDQFEGLCRPENPDWIVPAELFIDLYGQVPVEF